MSVVMVISVAVPLGVNILSGAFCAAAAAGAAAFGLSLDKENGAGEEAENSVDFCLDRTAAIAADIKAGQTLTFSGQGLKAIFHLDENGRVAVRISGRKSRDELAALGEALVQKTAQRYAYHRLVTEMKALNINVTEEEVEADGSIRLQARVFN